MEVHISEVTPDQLEQCAAVIRASFQTVADEFGITPQNNPTNGAFLLPEKLALDYEKGIRMFGLFEEGVLAGFVAIEKGDGSVYYLEKLAVLPDYRHKGYGRRLLDFAGERIRQAGGSRISIGLIDENSRLKSWYKSYGFAQTRLKRFDHLDFTVCFMALEL